MRKLFKLISIILIIALTFMASMTFAKTKVTKTPKTPKTSTTTASGKDTTIATNDEDATNANDIDSIIGDTSPFNAKGSVEKKTAKRILGLMQWVGYAIAIGMLIYIGIKYVSSAADERANLKGSLVKFVIGAALIAGACTFVNIVFNINA